MLENLKSVVAGTGIGIVEDLVAGTLTISATSIGTEYTEGDVEPTIIGSAVLMETSGNTLQPIQGSVAGGLLVDLGSNNDVIISDGGNSITVDDGGSSITVDNGGIFVVQENGAALTSLQLIDDTVYTDGTGSPSKGLAVMGTDGTNPQLMSVDSAGRLNVNVISGGGGASAGDVAHDAVDSGNPVKIGYMAENVLPTAVSDGDRANGISDLFGRLLVSHIPHNAQIWKAHNSTSTQTGVAIWTPTSGKKVVITSIIIGTYGTTSARVILWLGGSGDTAYTAGTDQLVLAASFAPDVATKPGLVHNPQVPIFASTADHVLKITTDAAISIDVTVYGYEI